jgi:hypothetical protein
MNRAMRQKLLHESIPLGNPVRTQIKDSLEPRIVHGGGRTFGKRKSTRPFSPKAVQHLVLRSSQARGHWNLRHRKNLARLQRMVYSYAHRYQVKVFQYAHLGQELHLLVRCSDRKMFSDYLRVLCGRTAVVVTGAKKGKMALPEQPDYHRGRRKFWDYLTWGKLIPWGAEFSRVRTFLKESQIALLEPNPSPLLVMKSEWLLTSNGQILTDDSG